MAGHPSINIGVFAWNHFLLAAVALYRPSVRHFTVSRNYRVHPPGLTARKGAYANIVPKLDKVLGHCFCYVFSACLCRTVGTNASVLQVCCCRNDKCAIAAPTGTGLYPPVESMIKPLRVPQKRARVTLNLYPNSYSSPAVPLFGRKGPEIWKRRF